VTDPVDALFRRQEGLASVAQLVALGVRAETVRRRVHAGHWRLVLPPVVCRDARPLDAGQRLVAACLLAGPGSALSSWTAASWHGIRSAASDRRISVAVPADRFVRGHAFVLVRRTGRPDPGVIATPSFAVASRPRATADAARDLGPRAARGIVLEAVQRRLVTTDELRHELEAGPRQGSGGLRAALAEAAQGVWAVPEAELAELVRGSRVLSEMWANPLLHAGAVRLPTPDGWFDDVGLAVQVHSKRYHAGELKWERTVSGDGVYAEHGIALVAFTPRQIASGPAAVLTRIERAYEQASRRPRPPVTVRRRDSTRPPTSSQEKTRAPR
jgi:hypothetical protein